MTDRAITAIFGTGSQESIVNNQAWEAVAVPIFSSYSTITYPVSSGNTGPRFMPMLLSDEGFLDGPTGHSIRCGHTEHNNQHKTNVSKSFQQLKPVKVKKKKLLKPIKQQIITQPKKELPKEVELPDKVVEPIKRKSRKQQLPPVIKVSEKIPKLKEKIKEVLDEEVCISKNTIGIGSDCCNQGIHSIAIGKSQCGGRSQSSYSIAIGVGSGDNLQSAGSVAVGFQSGSKNQGENSVAIGNGAGFEKQDELSIAIGKFSGLTNQAHQSIAIGSQSAKENQQEFSIAIGTAAGSKNQQKNSIAIGTHAGEVEQGEKSVAIGFKSVSESCAISIGSVANSCKNSIVLNATDKLLESTTESFYIKPIRVEEENFEGKQLLLYEPKTGEVVCTGENVIGPMGPTGPVGPTVMGPTGPVGQGIPGPQGKQGESGLNLWGKFKNDTFRWDGLKWSVGSKNINFGYDSGKQNQGIGCVAIGERTGYSQQNKYSIAVGFHSGKQTQGENCIAIGNKSGETNQKDNSISLGLRAGGVNQGENSIAIGRQAGFNSSNNNSIAIGTKAGFSNMGKNSIAIGTNASSNAPKNCDNYIVLNAGETKLDPLNSGLYINPIRIVDSNEGLVSLYYNEKLKEVVGFKQ